MTHKLGYNFTVLIMKTKPSKGLITAPMQLRDRFAGLIYEMNNRHSIIPFQSWRRAQIVATHFTLKEITTGIINPNRSKSSFNVFYSTFCSELNRCDRQEQTRVMGDGLREVQQHFQNIDAVAVDDAAGFDDAFAGHRNRRRFYGLFRY